MMIAILREPDFENRVSLVPETAKLIFGSDNQLVFESGCGTRSSYPDDRFIEAGFKIKSRADILKEADIILSIHPLSEEEIGQIKRGAWLFGLYLPLYNRAKIESIATKGISLLSLDCIPRITRAQSMDVLSSMTTASGYQAVLLAASHLPRFFPMLMTAAGTIPPAKVLILGAGVAGLQAIATARRLGAVVEAFDTRMSTKEQVESLGGKFVMVEGAVEDKAAGGYAVEQSDEFKQKQADAIFASVKKADVVISTAQIPGKKAPILITEDMVKSMRPGSVIVDLAASTGGNCELTENNAIVQKHGVTLIGNSNLQSQKAEDASRMFSKNLQNLFKLLIQKDGSFHLNMDDEIVRGTCVTHDGKIIYSPLLNA